MKAARLAVLGVALAAGLGAAYMMMGTKPPEPVRVAAPAPAPVATDNVLVAAHDLAVGAVVADADLRWEAWPKAQLPGGAIVQSVQPNAMRDLKGLSVNVALHVNDLVRADSLGKGAGLMSAVLPSGMRAVAIDLSDQGRSAAAGYIQPGDHVDVIRVFHPDDAPQAFASETILANVDVLAIAQADQRKADARTVIGGTATLEVTPEQAEKLILAQKTGQLTLSLRSMADATKDDVKIDGLPQSMTIIRFGNTTQARVR